jgi:hypothetical protein
MIKKLNFFTLSQAADEVKNKAGFFQSNIALNFKRPKSSVLTQRNELMKVFYDLELLF